MNQAAAGKSALDDGDYEKAIQQYTAAIKLMPEAVDYYIKRSTAFTRLAQPDHIAAYKDSEIAVVLAVSRGKRELILQAQLRRAITLFALDRWADAEKCLEWSQKFDTKDPKTKDRSLSVWFAKVQNKIKTADKDDARLKVTVQETPIIKVPKVEESAKSPATGTPAGQRDREKDGSTTGKTTEKTAPKFEPTPPSKIRHDWYQSPDSVTLTIFAKGVPKDAATASINPQSIEFSFPTPSGSDFVFSLDPLFSQIDPTVSSYKVLSTKVEFQLKKAVPGAKWATLEGSDPVDADQSASGQSAADADVKRAVLAQKPTNAAPSYPTSSKSGPKDWDKVATDLSKASKKEDGKDDKHEHGNADLDDDEDADPVNGFFKKLYKDADPDTRRAMMKSYQESNGTALSTNWSEVGKGQVETTPPEGMEAKKW